MPIKVLGNSKKGYVSFINVMWNKGMEKFISLDDKDNVYIVIQKMEKGESLLINGRTVTVPAIIEVGHKIAKLDITAGDKIIKYGVPIGSASTDISIGSHIHLHNMKSDYIPTYTVENF
jgi:hypothetical protein